VAQVHLNHSFTHLSRIEVIDSGLNLPYKTALRAYAGTSIYNRVSVRFFFMSAPSRFLENWIFPNTKGKFNVKSEIFNEERRRIHKELKIPYGKENNRTPYTCRHTRAAQLLSQGVPPAKGAEQLGHSVQMFLNVYSEWIDEYSDMDNSILEPAANYNG